MLTGTSYLPGRRVPRSSPFRALAGEYNTWIRRGQDVVQTARRLGKRWVSRPRSTQPTELGLLLAELAVETLINGAGDLFGGAVRQLQEMGVIGGG